MFDPAIKLFGKTISLPPAAEETGEEIQESSVERSLETDHGDQDENSQQEFHSFNGEQRKRQPKKESESSNQQKLNLKKPDKLLPCPRCNSVDTKFCYFNNYNVNQPRHFCKNCQRYWTAGGMMRNVPVGAGRRKNKHLRHLIVPSESTPSVFQVDHSDSGQSQPVRTVLKFGVDSPLCESMASVLHLSENGGESQPTQKSAPLEWTYPWTHALTGFAPAQMKDGSMLYGPAFVWGHGPAWPNQAWSLPLNFPSPSSSEFSGPMSPSLGKHCRDSSLTVEEKREKSIWTPKTLRIVDPDEAAKSSIWSTLGIKPDPEEPSKKAGIFKGFRHKMKDAGELSLEREKIMIHLNPAALSRSQTFQEST